MPAVLTHKAIMLLARARIRAIRDALERKVARGERVTDLEHRVLYFAKKCFEMMSEDEAARPSIVFPEGDVYDDPFGLGVSRFSVMGSMGPDITGFSGLFLKNQGWVFDTVHKGNPDHHKEPVVARTTDLSLELWRKARDAINSRTGEGSEFEAKKTLALRRMRAYTLGHLCHVAGDVISHPYINDVEWHLGVRGPSERERFTHARTEGTLDAKVAQQVFLRTSLREGGQEWTVWWPSVDEVPPEFFTAYDEALRSIYRDADGNFPVGFGKFESEGGAGDPPLSSAFVKDGYAVYKNAVMSMGYGWGWWSWWGYLIPAVVPALLMFPLLPAMPRGRQFLDRAPWEVEERGWYEMMMLPLFLGSVPALFYGIWLAVVTTHGIEGDVIAGLIGAGVTFVLGIIALSTVGVDDLSGEVRWGLLWLIPFLSGGYHVVRWLVELGEENKAKGALFAIYAAPALFMAVVFLLLGLVGMGITGLVHLADGDEATSSAVIYGIFTALVSIALLILWFWLPSVLRDARIPEEPEAFPVEGRHFVRTFDDAALFHAASVAAPDLGDRFYPSQTRELLKLWWDGDGDMHVRSRRTHLEFSFDGEGAPDQVVPSPLTPMTPEEYGRHLEATVREPSGGTGHLHFVVVYPADEAVFLPPGATFADEGDLDDEDEAVKTVEAHFERSRRFVKLAKSEGDASYTLRHAPRLAQAARVGRSGPVSFDPREPGDVAGPGTIQSTERDVTGSGTDFVHFFDVGDRIRAGGQIRTITLTTSETALKVNTEFSPALPEGTTYERIGEHEESRDGFRYVMDPGPGVLGGDTVMDLAGDLGALLCLGATPHLLADTELEVDTLEGRTFDGGGDPPRGVTPIQQVFRNWSLDRRRQNEWRMLVGGGAVDEKGGAPETFDAAMPDPRAPGWTAPSADVRLGEPVTRRLGWVPLLRRWVAMASVDGADASDPAGDSPTNQELSRAMAYLLDMPDPRVLERS